MIHILKSKWLVIVGTAVLLASCTREVETGILNTGSYGDDSQPLKDAADFPIGVAISYTPMTTDTKYAEVAKRDFDEMVFEYHMKHGAVVQDNGSFNFTNTDALVNAVGSSGLFGHTLGWHSNQNANYLKSYAGIVVPAAAELITNGGFESGLSSWSIFNSGNPAGTSTITASNVAGEVRTGTQAMKVVNPVGYPGSQWRVQVACSLMNTTPGKQYVFTYWVKAATAGGSIRLSTADQSGGNAQYQADQTIGTAWQQINWTITANSTQTRVLFDMGQAANTYNIDDASFKEVVATPNPGQIALKLDTALRTFISTMVGRYKSKVKAWDVVNEIFADNGGTIRNNNNTNITPTDVLVWSHYMGRDFALKAFLYAREADPAADLYINDYGLESSNAKLDSTIAYVNELKAKGAKINGIGTQMHINWNTSRAGIDNMMQKLAATGLKVRVSELDVRAVMTSAAGTLTPQLSSYQAEMYKYVVQSYIKHVPTAQRAGITVWGVNDRNSWLSNGGKEFPLLYDDNYQKKPAYGAFLMGLKQPN
jgi:endo-1,4-beta-xylanase